MSREELINRTVAALNRMYYEDLEFVCHFVELLLTKKRGKL